MRMERGLYFSSVCHSESRMCFTECDQTLVVVVNVCIGCRSGVIQFVYIVGRCIAVVIERAACKCLCSEEFLTAHHERNALRGLDDDCCEVVLTDLICFAVVAVGRTDLIPQCQVIVAVCIVDDLCRRRTPFFGVLYGVDDRLVVLCVAVDIAFFCCVKYGAFYHITNGVAEVCHTGSFCCVGVVCKECAGLCGLAAHVPAFAVDDDVAVDCVNCCADIVHCVYIEDAHQVETEAVEVIFLCPVLHGINDELADHRTFGSNVIAAAGGVLTGSVEVARNELVEAVVGVICMVVNNVHDNADACIVQRLNHLFEFCYSYFTVIRISGVGAFGSVVVNRVITPVELRFVKLGFVY